MTARGRAPRGRRPDVAHADTNLFVALFAGPGHTLHDAALDLFRRVADGGLALIVTPIVVAELVYVTRSVFRWDRSTTADHLSALLEADELVVHEGVVLLSALGLYPSPGSTLPVPTSRRSRSWMARLRSPRSTVTSTSSRAIAESRPETALFGHGAARRPTKPFVHEERFRESRGAVRSFVLRGGRVRRIERYRPGDSADWSAWQNEQARGGADPPNRSSTANAARQ